MDYPICEWCKHHRRKFADHYDFAWPDECVRKTYPDPVRGLPELGVDCRTERATGECGPEGKFYCAEGGVFFGRERFE